MTRKLLLIRHAQSQLTPGLPPERWPLTEAGRASCLPFAQRVAVYRPDVIFTSDETKAIETGKLVAGVLGLPVLQRPGLHEHRRAAFERPSTRENFVRSVTALFEQPETLVFGDETAAAAYRRYAAALQAVLAETAGNVAVVSHGTVMALWVAKYRGLDPLPIWLDLIMPDLVVIDPA